MGKGWFILQDPGAASRHDRIFFGEVYFKIGRTPGQENLLLANNDYEEEANKPKQTTNLYDLWFLKAFKTNIVYKKDLHD